MEAIGFAYGKLYGCKAGPYSVVVCAPDRKTAKEAFAIFLRNQRYDGVATIATNLTKQLGNRPLLWAQVDVTR